MRTFHKHNHPTWTAQNYTQEGEGWTAPRCSCPLPVKLYNQYMGGVDPADSRRKLYSCSRKSRRWWMCLFYFLVDVSVINSHVLTQESPQCFKLLLKEYVLKLTEEMMSQHNSRKWKGTATSPPRAPNSRNATSAVPR